MIRSDERGIALVAALFLTLILSLIGSSLMFVARTETLSSLNYKTMSQSRYAAESGLHVAANYLMFTYAPPGTPADPIAEYNTNSSPVTRVSNGLPVVLSSDPAVPSNYPVAAVVAAFGNTAKGQLNVGWGSVGYGARATLVSMRRVPDEYSGGDVTLQTWEITGVGTIGGAGSAAVEVTAVIDRQMVPAYRYAAFSTYDGCDSLSFAGGATTDSYDSTDRLLAPPGWVPDPDDHGADVGTNGGLTDSGAQTTIGGTLSTPRTGVGTCGRVVTAATNGVAPAGGLVKLPQSVHFPTPPDPNPLPPTTTSAWGSMTIDPAASGGVVTFGDVDVGSHAQVHLKAGTYVINSFTMNANAQIIVDSGPVIFHIAGQGFDANETVVKITGNGVSNTTYDPMNLQFRYGGSANIDLAGGAQTSALIYAPNAGGQFTGGADFYGAVILKQLKAAGGAAIHYDRNLARTLLMPGQFTMNQFTWKAF
jgi:Tfp pilus assembly protein PilX